MSVKIKFICAWLYFLCFVSIPELTYAQSETDFPLQHLTTEDGLSQNSVYKIYQDEHGFMFFGTQVGVDRYDGTEFRKIGISDNIIIDNGIRLLYEDTINKKLIIGTSQQLFKGACKANHNDFKNWSNKENIFYATMRENNLFYFNERGAYRNDTLIEYSTNNPIIGLKTIVEDAFGNIYFGTERGIFLSKNSNSLLIDSLNLKNATDSISVLYVGRNNGEERFFMGNEKGEVFKLNTSSEYYRLEIILPKQNSKITSLLLDKNSLLWIGTEDKGVFILKEKEIIGRLKRDFDDIKKLSSDNVLCIYESRDSTIWIGTDGGGINVYRPNRPDIKHITYANEDISDNHVWAIMKDGQKRLWLGTAGNGVIIYDEGKDTIAQQILSSDRNKEANHVHCFLKKDNEILLGTSNGLYKTSISGNSKYRLVKFQGEQIRCLASSNDNIFVGTKAKQEMGLYVLRNDYSVIDSAFHKTQVNDILVDEDAVWLTTYKGLKAYSPAKQDVIYHHKDVLDLMSIIKPNDTSSYYWSGSIYQGLMKFDIKNKILDTIHYTINRRDLIYGILADSRGGLWMSTNDGLLRYHPQDGLLDRYTKEDSLQSNEFNSGAFYATGDTLYFGGINGVNRIIATQGKDTFNQTIALEYFTSHTKTREIRYPTDTMFEEHIYLDNDFRYATIKPLVLHYTYPENSEIRYKINDKEWSNIRYGDEITLTRDTLKCYQFWTGKNTLKFQFRTIQSGWSNTHRVVVCVGWFSRLKLIALVLGLSLIGFGAFWYRKYRWNLTFRNLHKSINNISRQNSTDAIGNLITTDLMEQTDADYVIVSVIDFNKRILQVKYAGIGNTNIEQISEKYQAKYNKNSQGKIVATTINKQRTKLQSCDTDFDETETDVHLKFLMEELLEGKLQVKKIDRFLLPIIHRGKDEKDIELYPERSGHVQENTEAPAKDIPIGIVEVGKIGTNRFKLKSYVKNIITDSGRELYIDGIAQSYYDVLLDKRLKETYEATIKKNITEEEPDTFLNAFLKDICKLCEADYGNIALKTFNSKHINILEKEIFHGFDSKDIDEEQLRRISEKGEGITNHVFDGGKAYLNGNVNEDEENVVILKSVKSEMAVPIKNEEQTIGVLTLCSKENDFFNITHIYTFYNIVNQAIQEYLKKKQRYSLRQLAGEFNMFSDSEVPILEKVGRLLSQHFDSNYVAVWQRVSNKNYDFKLCEGSTPTKFYDSYKDSNFLKVSMNRGKLEEHEKKVEIKNNEEEKKQRIDKFQQKQGRIYSFCDEHQFPEYLVVKILIEDDYEILINVFSKSNINLNQNDYSFLEQVIDKTADALQGQKLLNTFRNFSNSLFDENVENTLRKIATDAVSVLHTDNVVLYPFENGKIVLTKAIIAGFFHREHIPVDDNQYTFVHFIHENGTEWMGNDEDYQNVLEGMNKQKQTLFKNYSSNAFRQRENIKAVAALKLEYDEDPLGIMFFNYRTEKDFTNPDTKKFIEYFANLANIVLRNIYYVKEIKKGAKKAEEDYKRYKSLSHNLKEQVKRLNIEKENVERKNIALYEKISTYLPWATQTSFYFIVKGVNHDIRHYLKRQSDFINQVLNSNTAPRELILNNQKELDRTVEMIENLLDIFDFDSSKKDMCDVNEIIEKIIYHFKKVEPTITYNMKKSYISDVFCYKPELTMIIYNIVNNAVFAVNKKFKDRKLKQGIIEFNTHSSENKVFITIKDNGIGIAKDDIGKIYDQNYSKKGGMGIGLYFVKQVLNLNFEGDIECKSKLGHWTKFTLKLPLSVNYK